MAVVQEFLTWMIESITKLWEAISTEWGIVGICFVCVPLVRRVFDLFKFYIRGGY